MTREEAIKRLEWLEMVAEYVDSVTIGPKCTEDWEAYNMAIAALREQDATDTNVGCKWISVEERLPEKSVPVLAYKDGRIWYCERNWQSGCWESLSFAATKEYGMYWSKGPTHWMPLPEPPKEEV